MSLEVVYCFDRQGMIVGKVHEIHFSHSEMFVRTHRAQITDQVIFVMPSLFFSSDLTY